MTTVEVLEMQNAIVKLQADAISELYRLLMQYITAEEADALPVNQKIIRATQLQADIGWES